MNVPVPDGRRRALVLAIFTLALAGFAGLSASGAVAVEPDPAAPGPYEVKHVDYRAGRIALTLPKQKGLKASFAQPLRGFVSYPATGSDWPVAVLLHGRHATCVDRRGRDFIPFPGEDDTSCPDKVGRNGKRHERWIRSYAGYRYIADRLASQGYMVVSADANRIASYEYFSVTAGIRARAQLVGATLDLVRRWQSGAENLLPEEKGQPASIDLAGKPDLGNIALMGHSRGGDAVTQFIAFNRKRSTVYPLDGVVAIGPTDMSGDDPFRSGGTNLAELLPGCDGDVSGLEGGHVFERVKNSSAGRDFSKFQWLVGGTNHNWFNSVWKEDDTTYTAATDLDSACGRKSVTSTRLSRAGQRLAGLRLVAGFVRTFAGGESQYGPALETGSGAPDVRASYIAPKANRRLVIGPAALKTTSRNNFGGSIRANGLKLSWCDAREKDYLDPLKRCPGFLGGDESVINRSWTRQLVIDWKRQSRLVTTLPATAADASAFRDLVFRAVTTLSGRNPFDAGQRLDVILTDRAGIEHSVAAESYSTALQHPAGDRLSQLLLSDVRIPLADFTGVNLADLASIRLEFGNRGRTHGQIQIADLAFQGPVIPAPFSASPETTAGPEPGPGTAIDAVLTRTAEGELPAASVCAAEPEAKLVAGPQLAEGKLTMSGTLTSPDCDSRVQVALFTKAGDLCRFVSSEGRPGHAGSCNRPYSLIPEVDSRGEWTLSIPWAGGPDAPDVILAAVPV